MQYVKRAKDKEYLLKLYRSPLFFVCSKRPTLILFCNCTISLSLSIINHSPGFFGNILLICFNSFISLGRLKDFKASNCFSVCFSKAFPKGECVNVACCIIWLRLEGSISSPVRYSYLSFLPDDKAGIFAASLLISYCSFSSLTLSSIAMIIFYIPSKRFSLKCKGFLMQEYYHSPKQNIFLVHFFCKES